jgi:transcriptional regulator with XRE-family HTH domain
VNAVEAVAVTRVLGRSLRSLRLRAGLTVKAAAGLLEWSEPKLWRIETGQTALRGLDVAAMCERYGTPPELAAALAELARETRHAPASGWWHASGSGFPDGFSVYAELEDEACQVREYASCQVPALLRTGAYARALIEAGQPGISPEKADRLMRGCLARQALITRQAAPLAASVILGEALLHRPAGGAAVMAGQLRHLAGVSGLENVSVRVVPFSAGAYPGMVTRSFTLLQFPAASQGRSPELDVVRVAGLTGELYLDRPRQVQRYHGAFAAMLACSLGEDASRDRLLSAAKDLQR